MNEKVKLAIGAIIFTSIIAGFTAYDDYVVSHTPKSGFIIESNIDHPDFKDVFIPAKNK